MLYRSPTPSCGTGYYCPFVDALNTSTYPLICSPSTECQSLRLQSLFCTAQGRREAIPCPTRYYCPNNTAKLPCPEGNYCPIGSVAPTPCIFGSLCPAKSNRQNFIAPLVAVIIVDLVVYLVYRCGSGRGAARRQRRDGVVRAVSPYPAQYAPTDNPHMEVVRGELG